MLLLLIAGTFLPHFVQLVCSLKGWKGQAHAHRYTHTAW